MADSYLGTDKEVIKEAFFLSTQTGEESEKPNIRNSPSPIIVAFPASRSPEDWFPNDKNAEPFGETEVDLKEFPSLRRISNDRGVAKVNGAFMARFVRILKDRSKILRDEVAKALDQNKEIIFTGYSSGGPIAIYATVWFLEQKRLKKKKTPRVTCLTFGSPLTTDRTFCHAIRREGWSDYFVHFVTKLDIVPRVLLAPSSSTRELLKEIVSLSDPHHKPVSTDNLTSSFVNVMKNASCVANSAACELTGNKHTLFDTMSGFIKLSPYRPCGKYLFWTETRKLVAVENPDAVLQLLFYSLQIRSDEELQNIAVASLEAHRTKALDESFLATPIVLCSKKLQESRLGLDDATIDDLNLCASVRLCLHAAGKWEQKKLDNQERIDGKKGNIEKFLDSLEKYRATSQVDNVGYYDAFKLQKKEEDFKANVKRLELAAIWDDIIEMIRQGELPDGFEKREEWVKLGTQFRRLVEPIDIANYYRHSRNDVAGSYMEKARPSRYKYTQRWLEHFEQLEKGSCGESCFWAEVEELNLAFAKSQPLNEQKNLKLAEKLEKWHDEGAVKKDAFLKETTLVKWWRSLPYNNEAKSCIRGLIVS